MASPSAWSVVPEGSASQWTPVKESAPEKPGFWSGVGESLNPLPAIKTALGNPAGGEAGLADLASQMIQSHIDQINKGMAAWKKGEHVEAIGHFGGAALPLVGPAAANIGEHIGDEGLTAQNAGRAAGLIGSVVIPDAIKAVAESSLPGKVSESVRNGIDTVDAATSPAVVRKAVKILPKGQTALDAYDAFQAERARLQAARAPSTARFSRDANSPAWSTFPDAEKPPSAPPITPSTALPSGRVPGGAAHGASLQAKVAAVAQAAATEAADPVLNAVAQMQGHADFSAAPAEAQVGIRAAASKIPAEMTPEQVSAFTGEPPLSSAPQTAPTTAQAPTPVTAPPVQPLGARPATAPVAAQAAQSSAPAGLSIAEQLRDEMLRNGTIQPSQVVGAPQAAPMPAETNLQDLMRNPASSTARAPEWIRQKEMASSEPKAVADGLYAEGKQTPEQAGAVYQAAARADKAVKLAQALHSGGITYADALKLEPEHWADIAKSLGVNKPSKTSIGEALFRLQRLEAAAKPPVGGIQ